MKAGYLLDSPFLSKMKIIFIIIYITIIVVCANPSFCLAEEVYFSFIDGFFTIKNCIENNYIHKVFFDIPKPGRLDILKHTDESLRSIAKASVCL